MSVRTTPHATARASKPQENGGAGPAAFTCTRRARRQPPRPLVLPLVLELGGVALPLGLLPIVPLPGLPVPAEPLGRALGGVERSIVPAPPLVLELGGVAVPLGLLPIVPLPGLPGLAAPGVRSLELRGPIAPERSLIPPAALTFSADRVCWSRRPELEMPCCCWNWRTADCVFGPIMPSTPPTS